MKLHRFLDTPLALQDAAAAEMLQEMRNRFMFNLPMEGLEAPKEDARSLGDTISSGDRQYSLLQGVAVIPVSGVLVSGAADPWYGETSYDTLIDQISTAQEDPEVRAIAMQVESPGGEVSGLFDLADTMFSMRGGKPVWSILDDYAYSAAYAIASASDYITVPRTGGVGSIGVITMHLDISKLLEDHGIKMSIIQYGERKSDYSLFKPLSDAARTRLQGQIDQVGEMFVDMVGRNRNLSRARVRATEAGLYMGAGGVEQGLADAVMSPQEAFAALLQTLGA
jgi:signal peptide peptidase SppA